MSIILVNWSTYALFKLNKPQDYLVGTFAGYFVYSSPFSASSSASSSSSYSVRYTDLASRARAQPEIIT